MFSYDNIGDKIKRMAIFTFVAEAIGAIIGGFVLIGNDDAGLGVLLLLAGPIVAWVSSWILYAFGELVEKTVANEKNTSGILAHLQGKKVPQQEAEQIVSAALPEEEKEDTPLPEGTYQLSLSVWVEQNLFLSKYDVDVYIDGKHQCRVKHGTVKKLSVAAAPGTHVITFVSTESASIKNDQTIIVEQETEAAFDLTCCSDTLSCRKIS